MKKYIFTFINFMDEQRISVKADSMMEAHIILMNQGLYYTYYFEEVKRNDVPSKAIYSPIPNNLTCL